MNLRPFFWLSLGFVTVVQGFYKDSMRQFAELVAPMGLAYFSSDYGAVYVFPKAKPKAVPEVDLLELFQDDTDVIRLHWDGAEPALKFCATAALTIQELAITAYRSNELRIVQATVASSCSRIVIGVPPFFVSQDSNPQTSNRMCWEACYSLIAG